MRALNFCTLTLFFNEGFNFFLTLLLVRNICVLFNYARRHEREVVCCCLCNYTHDIMIRRFIFSNYIMTRLTTRTT